MPSGHSDADDEMADARFLARWLERFYVAYPDLLDGNYSASDWLTGVLAPVGEIGQTGERHHSLTPMIAQTP